MVSTGAVIIGAGAGAVCAGAGVGAIACTEAGTCVGRGVIARGASVLTTVRTSFHSSAALFCRRAGARATARASARSMCEGSFSPCACGVGRRSSSSACSTIGAGLGLRHHDAIREDLHHDEGDGVDVRPGAELARRCDRAARAPRRRGRAGEAHRAGARPRGFEGIPELNAFIVLRDAEVEHLERARLVACALSRSTTKRLLGLIERCTSPCACA